MITVREDLSIEFGWKVPNDPGDPSKGTYRKLWEKEEKLYCRFGSDKIEEIRAIFAILEDHGWKEKDSTIYSVSLNMPAPLGVVAYRLYVNPGANSKVSVKNVEVREVPSASYLESIALKS